MEEATRWPTLLPDQGSITDESATIAEIKLTLRCVHIVSIPAADTSQISVTQRETLQTLSAEQKPPKEEDRRRVTQIESTATNVHMDKE